MIKRISLLSLLSLFVFFFAACGSPPPDRSGFAYTGTVKQVGSSYVLATDNDQFKIRSSFLDITPYFNQKIKVHGQFSQDTFFIDDIKPAAVNTK